MNFSYSEAASVANEMKTIANQVRDLFEDTANTIQTVSNEWESTSDYESSRHALDLYNSHKSHFDEFINEIINEADTIINAGDVYGQAEQQVASDANSSFKING